MAKSSSTTLLPKGHGLRQLLSKDPSQFLLYAVEAVQAQADPRRVNRVVKRTRRRREVVGWVHVSDTLQPCDLKIGARLLGYKLPGDPIGHRLQRIFDNGHMMHFRWQNYFMSLPPSFKVEISPLLRCWPVIGEADIIVEHEHFGRVVVELKSMNTNQFSKLKTADGDHTRQVNRYVGLDGKAQQAQVWYENKDNQEVKTYWYEPDTQDFDDMMERAQLIVAEVTKGKMPKGCGVCGLDDYIGELKWDEKRLVALEAERAKWQKNPS